MTKELSKFQNNLLWKVLLCALCCFFLIANVNAQSNQEDDPNVSESRNTPPGSPSWVPPSAPPDKFDWIQLTSDEWLKGDLKVLYDDKLEFDSDELDLLELDWEDVKQVRGHRLHSVRFEGPLTVIGILRVVDDKVFVTTEDEVLEFDRSHLVSIAQGEPKEINYWSAKISISLDVRGGNSDQTNYSTAANARRRTAQIAKESAAIMIFLKPGSFIGVLCSVNIFGIHFRISKIVSLLEPALVTISSTLPKLNGI